MIGRRLQELRANQDGFALPEVIMSVIINAVCLTVIATAVATFLALQGNIEKGALASGEMTLSDSAWRSDVQDATVIGVTDAHQVSFTVPNPDSTCRQSTWTVQVSAAKTIIVRSIVNFPAVDPGTSACTGAPAPAIIQTVIRDASTNSGFTFKNRSGRGLTFVAGSATAAADTAPAGVSAARWNELLTGAATLDATGSASDPAPVRILISQVAASVFTPTPAASTSGTPDAGTSHAN